MTNIRAAVNKMTDEELAKTLSPIFTIVDGVLVDCYRSNCLECDHAQNDAGIDDFSCRVRVEKFMMSEIDLK